MPPFPYAAGYERLSKGLPILFREGLTEDDRRHLHFGEVALEPAAPHGDGAGATEEAPRPQLVTSGVVGYVMVVTGCGPTVPAARAAAYARVEKVCLPNGRYRRDIGERFLEKDEARLEAWGWLGRL